MDETCSGKSFKINRPKYIEFRYNKDEVNLDKLLQEIEAAGFDVLEPKYDGIWGTAHFQPERNVVDIYSRTGALKHTIRKDLTGVEEAVLYGEFMFGTQWSRDPELTGRFFVFDAASFGGENIKPYSLWVRRSRLMEYVGKLSQGYRPDDIFKICPQIDVRYLDFAWGDFIDDGLSFEGFVFKRSGEPFGSDWGRIKVTHEVDYVVMGFNPSLSGKYEGNGVASIIGGLYVQGILTPVCNVAGLSASVRQEFFQNPDKYIGKVFKAAGKGVFEKTGALRHPSFMEFHKDKLPEDCYFGGE